MQISIFIHQINQNQSDWNLSTLWFLSDTFFEKESSDLQAYLTSLKNFKWFCNFIFFSYTENKIIQLSKKFNKSINHSEISQEHQNFITKFSNLSAFLWFRESVKLIDLIKIFLICFCMKFMMLDTLLISSILNISEIFKLLFKFKWNKIFIIKCKHEKLSAQRAIASILFVKNLVRAFYKTRICAVFSYLIKFLEKEIINLI